MKLYLHLNCKIIKAEVFCEMDISKFKHIYEHRVRTYEVDSQGIVHNSNYLRYLENGRIEYRRSFGVTLNSRGVFSDGIKVMVVHNSIDYFFPAFLDDELKIFTRIAWIKNSSFCFESMILKVNDDKPICNGKGILVHIDEKNNPVKIPDKFLEEIIQFEGSNLQILR